MRRIRCPSGRAPLSAAAGVLVALSLPPWGLWPLAFVGIALFEASLAHITSRGRRFRLGWLFGAGWMSLGMVWMWFLTAPGYLIAAALFAGLHGVAAAATPTGRWRAIAGPAAHTLVEALRFGFPFGGVPLASLAIGQSAGPLIGVVRIGGVLLLTWVTFQLPAIAVAVAFPDRPAGPGPATGGVRSRLRAPALIGVGAVVTTMVLAAVAPSGTDTGRSLRVAVVQGGGPQGTNAATAVRCGADGEVDTTGTTGTTSGSRCTTLRQLTATSSLRADAGIDVVVWPENVIDVVDFASSVEKAEISAEAARLGATFLVGVTEETADDRFTNAQVVVSASGRNTDRYDKVRRVPFGEYMPLRDLLTAVGAPTDLVPRDAVAGTGPAYLSLPTDSTGAQAGVRVAVVISWEVFFGGRARDGVGHGGQLLINPTNGSSYTWTVLQSQQVASSRLRAIETGRWVVQAAPTGFSAFVSPDADVIARTGISVQRVIVHDIALRTGSTWYVSLGDRPWIALLAVAFVASWWAARAARPRSTLVT